MNIIDKYMEQLKEKLFPKTNQKSQRQIAVFKERYNPNNQEKRHTEIADLIADQYEQFLGDKGFSEDLRRVGEKIIDTFKTEIINDNYNPDEMDGRKRYPLTYEWLWEYKFPREAWALCQECASRIQASGEPNRDVKLPPNPNHVKVNEHWQFKADFGRSGYLYLINQGSSGNKYLLSPSSYFAKIPVTELPKNHSFCMPWDDNHYPLSFSTVGEEYFLAIVTEKPLTLSWLEKDATDIELNEVKLRELFLQMIKDSNLGIFDRQIKIIE